MMIPTQCRRITTTSPWQKNILNNRALEYVFADFLTTSSSSAAPEATTAETSTSRVASTSSSRFTSTSSTSSTEWPGRHGLVGTNKLVEEHFSFAVNDGDAGLEMERGVKCDIRTRRTRRTRRRSEDDENEDVYSGLGRGRE